MGGVAEARSEGDLADRQFGIAQHQRGDLKPHVPQVFHDRLPGGLARLHAYGSAVGVIGKS